jgi:GH25 family lysozyme M1 (1,4-beta-N-acetylmuramidase)
MKIVLVRHGQTEDNFEGIMQGTRNVMMNDTGRRQCKKLREKLSDKKFDVCYMSPLVRCVETAFILVGDKTEMIRDDRLIERDLGELEGKNRDVYDIEKYWNYDLNSSDSGVESVRSVIDRCRDFLEYITSKYDNINEYIKEEEKEEEKIKYVCVKEEKEIKDNTKKAIDISSWQGNIDFEKVKNSNLVDYVVVRIGYGTTLSDDPVVDSKFKRNINELKKYNIPYGVYLFGYAQNLNASNIEVNFIDNMFKKYDIPKDTFIWYDAELTTFNSFYYSKTIYNMVIDNFVFRLNDLGYKNVGVYGNLFMLTKGSLSYDKKYPVWVAQYNSKCEYEGEYKGWQYTSDGHVDGIDGRVDMDIFY